MLGDLASPAQPDGNSASSRGTRQAILVLGMHRSGTSAVTRIINLLGADLPGNLMSPKDENPEGYWESQELMRLHDQILSLGEHASQQDQLRIHNIDQICQRDA